MIDLHSHILPGIDDGAVDISQSRAMARAWIDDGVGVVACTPHILPGVYANTGPQIRAAVAQLQNALDDAGLALRLVTGADNHIVGNFVHGLRSGHLLPLAGSRYVLIEPPHHVAPVRLEDLFFDVLVAGYVPILTHPERLSWVPQKYDVIRRLVQGGVWMQITAGSLTGGFGRQARYWAEKMLDDGLVHILATDAHDTERRPPVLGAGRELAAKRVGAGEATHLVETRPRAVLDDAPVAGIPMPEIRVTDLVVAHSEDGGRSRGVVRSAYLEGDGAGNSGGLTGRLRRLFD